MENKKGSGGRAGAMAGKGFYIVLFLCAAVIGATAWILATEMGTHVDDSETAQRVVDISDAVVTMIPAGTPMDTDDESVPTISLSEDETDDEPISPEREEETAEVFSDAGAAYVWPVHGGVEVPYAIQSLLYDATMADWRTHDGIDIACALGDEVMAACSGTVVSVSDSDLYGTVITIDHGNGVKSTYANLAQEPPVWEGEWVSTGQIIGSVGNTALVETNEVPHLHFAVTLDGRSADPMEYLDSDYAQDE